MAAARIFIILIGVIEEQCVRIQIGRLWVREIRWVY